MYKKNVKWLLLGILAIIILTVINFSSSKYTTTLNTQITLNIKKPTYTIRFHPNNGGEDSYKDQSFTYGTAQNLTVSSFTKSGNRFKEWNTEVDGSGVPYADEAEVINLTRDKWADNRFICNVGRSRSDLHSYP